MSQPKSAVKICKSKRRVAKATNDAGEQPKPVVQTPEPELTGELLKQMNLEPKMDSKVTIVDKRIKQFYLEEMWKTIFLSGNASLTPDAALGFLTRDSSSDTIQVSSPPSDKMDVVVIGMTPQYLMGCWLAKTVWPHSKVLLLEKSNRKDFVVKIATDASDDTFNYNSVLKYLETFVPHVPELNRVLGLIGDPRSVNMDSLAELENRRNSHQTLVKFLLEEMRDYIVYESDQPQVTLGEDSIFNIVTTTGTIRSSRVFFDRAHGNTQVASAETYAQFGFDLFVDAAKIDISQKQVSDLPDIVEQFSSNGKLYTLTSTVKRVLVNPTRHKLVSDAANAQNSKQNHAGFWLELESESDTPKEEKSSAPNQTAIQITYGVSFERTGAHNNIERVMIETRYPFSFKCDLSKVVTATRAFATQGCVPEQIGENLLHAKCIATIVPRMRSVWGALFDKVDFKKTQLAFPYMPLVKMYKLEGQTMPFSFRDEPLSSGFYSGAYVGLDVGSKLAFYEALKMRALVAIAAKLDLNTAIQVVNEVKPSGPDMWQKVPRVRWNIKLDDAKYRPAVLGAIKYWNDRPHACTRLHVLGEGEENKDSPNFEEKLVVVDSILVDKKVVASDSCLISLFEINKVCSIAVSETQP